LKQEGVRMDAVRKVCAGLDVHQKTIVACVLQGPLEEKPKADIRTRHNHSRNFGTAGLAYGEGVPGSRHGKHRRLVDPPMKKR
jgi:hypothetical protein